MTDLTLRFNKLYNTKPIAEYRKNSVDDYLDLCRLIGFCNSFESLPKHVQDLILEAEKEYDFTKKGV